MQSSLDTKDMSSFPKILRQQYLELIVRYFQFLRRVFSITSCDALDDWRKFDDWLQRLFEPSLT